MDSINQINGTQGIQPPQNANSNQLWNQHGERNPPPRNELLGPEYAEDSVTDQTQE